MNVVNDNRIVRLIVGLLLAAFLAGAGAVFMRSARRILSAGEYRHPTGRTLSGRDARAVAVLHLVFALLGFLAAAGTAVGTVFTGR
jgi:hypothetical protein